MGVSSNPVSKIRVRSARESTDHISLVSVVIIVFVVVIIIIIFVRDNVIKWRHFLRYWTFVRGIHRWPVNSSHKASDAKLWCFLWSIRLNKRLCKQLWGWWFETPTRSKEHVTFGFKKSLPLLISLRSINFPNIGMGFLRIIILGHESWCYIL